MTASASAAPAPTSSPPIAATPPMGWNDWYSFFCNLDEQLIEQTADAMVSSGMRDAGYQYVNLDDCWLSHNRDANGNLQADPVKFPHGIKAVADYVHARGLKLGIYEDVGTATCAGYPGSYGHVQQDADTFASWGIDFVKVDWCNVPFGNFSGLSQQDVAKKLYTEYSQALQATGRPMLFSICEWNPALRPWTWAPAISNMWRTNNDYGDSWDRILANLDNEADIAQYAGPGHWNDPDILQVGLGGMTQSEDQAHFSAWAMLAAPLLAGNDLRSMSAATKAILTNREVIAIDQDGLGAQATRISHDGDADVWVRPLADGDRAVMLLNRGALPLTIDTTAQAAGLGNAPTYKVRDTWTHTTTESAGHLAASVPGHSAVLLRVTPQYDVGTVAPSTLVAATPDVAPVYPGSTYRIVRPGQTVDVPAGLRNDDRIPVTDARLTLTGPDGWTVQGSTAHAPAVPGGDHLDGTWRVTVPNGTSPGVYTVTATAQYRWLRGSATRTGTGGFQVLVPPTGTRNVSDLTWLSATNGYGPPVLDKNYYGGPLTIHGVTYPKGIWLNANAALTYYTGGNCTRLTADLGLDDSDHGPGTVDYQVFADGAKVYDSGTVTRTTATVHLDQGVTGAQILQLVVTDAGDGVTYDNADIAAPQLTCSA
ncbi:MAG TPA: NPCBM/NEW2 domain-containing protein [Jatrophihabitantaceae bacterium]